MAADRTIAVVYGKGGIGKSMVSSHLSVALAERGRRVLLVGCDPKADTSMRILGDLIPPTVIGTLEQDRPLHLDELIVPSAAGVDVLETGGAEPGTGCAGRGVVTTIALLERDRARLDRYDAIVFDVLGDLVCGGFVAPLRFAARHKVFVVTSEETASLFAANNVVKVVRQPHHGDVTMGGLVFNLRTDAVPPDALEEFAGRLGTRILATFRRDPVIVEAEQAGMTALQWAPRSDVAERFRALAREVEDCEGVPGREVTPLAVEQFREFVRRRIVRRAQGVPG